MGSFPDLTHLSSLRAFITRISREHASSVAWTMRRRVIQEKIYFRDIPSLVNRIDAFLSQNHIHRGDRVLIFSPNCPEYALLLLTLCSTGRVAVPVDVRTSNETLEKIIRQTKPKGACISQFIDSASIKQYIRHRITVETLFDKLPQAPSTKMYRDKPAPLPFCEIVYTSGTTGTPKGVMISEQNIFINLAAISKRLPHLASYRTISILPLSHMLEQIVGLYLSLALGSTVTYLPRVNTFKLRQAMKESKPTYLIFVPQLLNLFWDRIEEEAKEINKEPMLHNLLSVASYLPRFSRRLLFANIHHVFGGHLEFIGCGGAPLDYTVAERFNRMGFRILEGYGATEVTAAASFNTNPNRLGHVGKPLDGVQIRISAQKDIFIKSASVSEGYFKNKEKTTKVFTKGWYKTGDIGELDPEGNLRIIGRDFFKLVLSNGEKVYVEDIERKITTHPLVKDSCVIGVRDGNADQIHAVLLLKNQRDEKNVPVIIREINQTLESKQQIYSYSVWRNTDFPRTPTLKIDRNQIKDIAHSTISTNIHREDSLQFSIKQLDILDILSHISKIDKHKISDSDVLTSDLSMDSLDRAELTSSIEEYLGVTVDAMAINSKTTVGGLKKLVNDAQPLDMAVSYHSWQFSPWGEALRFLFYHLILFPLHGSFVNLQVANPKQLNEITPRSILVFNHAGLLDGACVLRLLGDRASKVVTPSYSGFWKGKHFHKLLELTIGGLPLDQTGKDLIPLLRTISDLIEGDRYLLFAPQGRLQNGPVQDKFKVGIGFFARELNLPVIPIKLIDYEKIWPAPKIDVEHMKLREVFPRKRGIVKIKIGKKIYPHELKTPIEMANRIEEEFSAL